MATDRVRKRTGGLQCGVLSQLRLCSWVSQGQHSMVWVRGVGAWCGSMASMGGCPTFCVALRASSRSAARMRVLMYSCGVVQRGQSRLMDAVHTLASWQSCQTAMGRVSHVACQSDMGRTWMSAISCSLASPSGVEGSICGVEGRSESVR